MMRVCMLAMLLAGALAVAVQASTPVPPPPAAAPPTSASGFSRLPSDFNNGPNDVHLYVKDVVNAYQPDDHVVRVENQFTTHHERVMGKLNKLLRKVGGAKPAAAQATKPAPAAAPEAKPVSLAEVAQSIAPIIDNTGTASFTPKADLTKFKVRPAIDASLVQDPRISQIEAEAEQRKLAQEAEIDRFRAQVAAMQGTALLELDAEAELAAEAEAEAEADAEFAADIHAFFELAAEVDAEVDAEAEADADADSESWTNAELSDSSSVEMVPAEIVAMEVAAQAEIQPIIDNTGTASFTPKADLTKFKVRPAIDASLVQDPRIGQIEAEAEQRQQQRAAVVDRLKQQAVQFMASMHHQHQHGASLLESANNRQDLPVVENPASVPAIDRPLVEAQHKAVDWMLADQKLSIKQTDLDAARDANLAAAGVAEHVADFKEQNQNQPLVPFQMM